jgi:hypothetical protein
MKSPHAPVARHSISSPPPPAIYHSAMIVYHQFTLDRRNKPDLDFLSYWFAESRNSRSSDWGEAEDSTSDILKGIEEFRNKVVEQCRGRSVSLLTVRAIVYDLERNSKFNESKEYWKSVIESLQNQPSSSVPLSDLSEAVVSFLKSIDSSSGGSSVSGSSNTEEIEALRSYVNKSLSELRSEIRRESAKLQSDISGLSTAVTSSKSSPISAPSLPIESRRQQESINGNRSMRREWCASCADDICNQQ